LLRQWLLRVRFRERRCRPGAAGSLSARRRSSSTAAAATQNGRCTLTCSTEDTGEVGRDGRATEPDEAVRGGGHGALDGCGFHDDPLVGDTNWVRFVVVSPDGHRLASASDDDTVRILNADTGQSIGDPLSGHTSYVTNVDFSPDGTRIVSGSGDGTIRLWPALANPDDLCHKLSANMSHRQWRDRVSPDIDYVAVCPGLPVPADSPS